MKYFSKPLIIILILIPVGLFISFLDKKVISGFLSTNQISDHYLFIGSLVIAITIIIFIVLKFDKKINS